MFVSSHLLSEMALTAAELVVIGRGKLIAAEQHRGVRRPRHGQSVKVRSPQLDDARPTLLSAERPTSTDVDDGADLSRDGQ